MNSSEYNTTRDSSTTKAWLKDFFCLQLYDMKIISLMKKSMQLFFNQLFFWTTTFRTNECGSTAKLKTAADCGATTRRCFSNFYSGGEKLYDAREGEINYSEEFAFLWFLVDDHDDFPLTKFTLKCTFLCKLWFTCKTDITKYLFGAIWCNHYKMYPMYQILLCSIARYNQGDERFYILSTTHENWKSSN